MSIRLLLADLAHIVVTPDIPNYHRCAFHDGVNQELLVVYRDMNSAWQLRDGGDFLTALRADGALSVVVDDDT